MFDDCDSGQSMIPFMKKRRGRKEGQTDRNAIGTTHYVILGEKLSWRLRRSTKK